VRNIILFYLSKLSIFYIILKYLPPKSSRECAGQLTYRYAQRALASCFHLVCNAVNALQLQYIVMLFTVARNRRSQLAGVGREHGSHGRGDSASQGRPIPSTLSEWRRFIVRVLVYHEKPPGSGPDLEKLPISTRYPCAAEEDIMELISRASIPRMSLPGTPLAESIVLY
jgi:hypothetical protein